MRDDLIRYAYREVNVGRGRFLVLDSDIPADAPPEVREGLARRAVVNGGGRCPCGAQVAVPGRKVRRYVERHGLAMPVPVLHRAHCPAENDNLAAAVDRWRAEA